MWVDTVKAMLRGGLVGDLRGVVNKLKMVMSHEWCSSLVGWSRLKVALMVGMV